MPDVQDDSDLTINTRTLLMESGHYQGLVVIARWSSGVRYTTVINCEDVRTSEEEALADARQWAKSWQGNIGRARTPAFSAHA